ncbi:hypothetical protein JCM6882_001655 [Rhodosporidiobolus microsporus]
MSALTSGKSVEELLNIVLDQVPEEENPYTVLRLALLTTLAPEQLPPLRPLLIAVSVLAGIPPLVLAASLIVRWQKGSLWLFRLHRTCDGSRYILPHYLSSWSFFLVILFGVLQGDIWHALGYGPGRDRVYWMLLIWVPGYTALCFATWTLACAYIIHVKAFTARLTWRWFYSPWLLNTLGIFVPIAHLAVVVVLSVLTAQHFHHGLDEYMALDRLFGQLEGRWEGGEVDLDTLRGTFPTAQKFLDEWRAFTHWFTTTCWFYGATGLVIGASLVFVAMAYIRALRRHAVSTASVRVARNDFGKTRWWLTVVTCAFALVFTALVANFLWIGALGDKPFTSSKIGLIANVLPFYLLTIPCIPVSIILLLRAFHDPAHASSAGASSSRYKHDLSSSASPAAPLHHILAFSTLNGSTAPASRAWHPFSARPTGSSDGHGSKCDEKGFVAGDTPTSGAFENLELQVSIGTDLPSFVRNLDAEVSSIGKDVKDGGAGSFEEDEEVEVIEQLDSPVAHPDPQMLKKVGTRDSLGENAGGCGSKKKKRSQGWKAGGGQVEGVQVTRETVVTRAEEVDETDLEAAMRRQKELFANAPW